MDCAVIATNRTRGDTWTIHGVIADGGVPRDLSAATLTAQLRDADDNLAGTFAVVVDPDETGRVALHMPSSATVGIAPGIYTYDIEVVEGGDPQTYGTGGAPLSLRVIGDATREVTP